MSITARIDNVTELDEAFRHETTPCPPSMKIELTSACNYKCSYCAHQLHLRPAKIMDRALFSRIIREFKAAGGREIGLFYIGESFLCSWLPEAIAEVKEIGIGYCFLTTNGSQATPERVEACMKAGLDSLKFSINYADAAQFRDIAGVNEKWFDIALGNLKEARRIRDAGRYVCKIYASSIELSGEQATRMERLLDEKVRPYVDEHYYLPLFGFGGDATAAEAAKGLKPTPGNPGRAGNRRESLPCWAVFREAHVTVDGLLSACCFGHSDRWTMADLTKTSFQRAWNNKEFRLLRRAHLDKNVSNTACAACIAAQ